MEINAAKDQDSVHVIYDLSCDSASVEHRRWSVVCSSPSQIHIRQKQNASNYIRKVNVHRETPDRNKRHIQNLQHKGQRRENYI